MIMTVIRENIDMTYSEAKKLIKGWRNEVRMGGDTDRTMIHKIVGLEAKLKEFEAQLTEERAWRHEFNANKEATARYVTDLLKRTETAEAKLRKIDSYGFDQWESGVSGTEFEAGPYETFEEWLAQQREG